MNIDLPRKLSPKELEKLMRDYDFVKWVRDLDVRCEAYVKAEKALTISPNLALTLIPG